MLILLGVLLATSFLSFLYFFYMLLYWCKNTREYRSAKKKEVYLTRLESKFKRCREGRRKNFLLYLSILTLQELGKENEAEKLTPFLKEDALLGIKK